MRRIWAFTLPLLLVGCVQEVEVVEEESTVTIRSIGDILVHSDVYTTARTDTGFDFSRMFEPVSEYMQDADITTANMEVPVAGEEFGLSGYPQFNAPPEIIDALAGAGVDIVNNATNHSMDRGDGGVVASTDNMRERGMLYTGSYASEQDKSVPRIIEANGITVGFLGFTYGTNGLPVEQEHFASLIDDTLAAQVAALDSQVDVAVVMLHMGDEYAPLPNEFQEETAATALDAGADLVLGGHPHVVEPFAGPVWYSHGNFLHGQWDEPTKVGGIGEFTFSGARFMPTYTVGPPIRYEHHVIPLVEAADYLDVHKWMADLRERLNVEVVDYL
ncbi:MULTISPECIES: CapA family protein [unclassified Corynebacterium]|uniref:CapA family protein n=1 Tax=unclassified Corynebacterium TaxID=2624378 RepID=UPI001EF6D8B9|nr:MULTISPECIES: CapA family protein [unclassified Corynebacterium]MCG7289679.1 CapA family protein [Corynebacterium sp. ACRPZ]MCG7293983.1 CapA family protein [Corynebacterium sp. ACRPY]